MENPGFEPDDSSDDTKSLLRPGSAPESKPKDCKITKLVAPPLSRLLLQHSRLFLLCVLSSFLIGCVVTYALFPDGFWYVCPEENPETAIPDKNLDSTDSLIHQIFESVTSHDVRRNVTRSKLQPVHPGRQGFHFRRTRRRLPQCIIIGVRKCGTRALLEFLNLHPQIQKAAEEVHFFDDDSKYALGLDWYRRKMPYSFEDQITVEKSPAYFVTPAVPSRIRAMNHSTKLLLILRDPVTRTISDYAQILYNREQKGKSFGSFAKVAFNSSGAVNEHYRAIQISIYVRFLRFWLDIFPENQIHIVSGDRFIEDPFEELRKVEDFLELDHRISRSNFYFNRTKGFYCLRNETTEKCLSDTKGRKHPQVPPEIIHKLRKFFKPHNQQLYDLIGRNMGWPEY